MIEIKNVYGRNVFITGASSGIGQACAHSFAKAGCHVIGAAIDCAETVKHYENGGIFELHNMDVTNDCRTARCRQRGIADDERYSLLGRQSHHAGTDRSPEEA